MTPIERNVLNLSDSLSFYGRTRRHGKLLLITASVRYSVFNISLLTSPVTDDNGEFEQLVNVAAEHYGEVGHPWSIWVCEDLIARKVARRLPEMFDRLGLGCIAEPPGMELPDFPAPSAVARPATPPLTFREAIDSSTRNDFGRLTVDCFHIPPEIARRVYGDAERWNSLQRVWVGYLDGLPVTSAATVTSHGVLGVYSVGTRPEYRRRGYAEAVMRHAVCVARGRGAEGPLLLQSSPAGMSLYRDLGFKRTTRYSVYATYVTIG